MSKPLFFSTAVVIYLGSSIAVYAACTPGEIVDKASKVTKELQEQKIDDPQKLIEISDNLEKISLQLALNGDLDDACKAYDLLLEKIGA